MTWTTQRICVLAATVLLIAGSAVAQSVYNLNLLGTRLANGDVQATALGGDVQIVPDTLGVLQRNPAILAYSKRVTFGAAVFSTVDENESAEFSDREGGFKFTALAFAFTPVKRLTMAIGYRADYDATGGFTTPDTTDAGGPLLISLRVRAGCCRSRSARPSIWGDVSRWVGTYRLKTDRSMRNGRRNSDRSVR